MPMRPLLMFNAKVGETLARITPPIGSSTGYAQSGTVVEVTEDEIVLQVLVDIPRQMRFSRQTGAGVADPETFLVRPDFLEPAPAGLPKLPEAVATVQSWTNGSYWRNYKLEWANYRADKGDQLCLLRDVQGYGDARAAAALAGEPVDLANLVDGAWYWVSYEGLAQTYTAPARYKAEVDCWYSHDFAGVPSRQVTVLSALVVPQQVENSKAAQDN